MTYKVILSSYLHHHQDPISYSLVIEPNGGLFLLSLVPSYAFKCRLFLLCGFEAMLCIEWSAMVKVKVKGDFQVRR